MLKNLTVEHLKHFPLKIMDRTNLKMNKMVLE